MTHETLLILRPAHQDPPGTQEPIVRRTEEGTPTAPAGTEQPGAPAGPPATSDPCLQQLPFILAIVVIFYFLLLRPQQKQEKNRRHMLAALKVGDDVVTSGGMHGTVASMDADTVTVRVDQKIKLTFDRSGIARVLGGEKVEKKNGAS